MYNVGVLNVIGGCCSSIGWGQTRLSVPLSIELGLGACKMHVRKVPACPAAASQFCPASPNWRQLQLQLTRFWQKRKGWPPPTSHARGAWQEELSRNDCRTKSIDVWQRGVDTEVFHPRFRRSVAVWAGPVARDV
jgi:hypothetical protein